MKFLDEYRDADGVRRLAANIARDTTRPHTIMEICGGQTHAILRFGLDELLPPAITLLHGPGCPVCVTPVAIIDQAIALTRVNGVTLASFGDMLRVPGSDRDLLAARAEGGDVRVVFSPLDAVALARENPDRQVVFFAVGFETTAPANAMAVAQAHEAGLRNFSILSAQVLVPPAVRALLGAPDNRVQAFLAAGHVCAVTGYEEYEPLARAHRVPIVVTGFEPLDILEGIHRAVRQLEEGRGEVENAYTRVVKREGNPAARGLVRRVFRVVDREWRGIGVIPASGLGLSEEYSAYDAAARFGVAPGESGGDARCIGGRILTGTRKPNECPNFGTLCTPESPLGAPMVSAEGACAAYFRYRSSHA